ncbi:hypothetical protein SDJN02_05469, partial [Cucurbita argyrosperma subsp. argyrosperma]
MSFHGSLSNKRRVICNARHSQQQHMAMQSAASMFGSSMVAEESIHMGLTDMMGMFKLKAKAN